MKLSATEIQNSKNTTPLAMLTAYSAPMARYLERAGIPILLVGDSLAMVELGFTSTREVGMEVMCNHTSAVRRGAPATHIIGDMPYGADVDVISARANARLLIEAGADAVKLEGPQVEVIRAIRADGIAVAGHIGLLPQTAKNFKQVGRDSEAAQHVIADAHALVAAGCYLIVLEHIPDALAATITKEITIPTIGIGAGNSCDGQVLVLHDILGLSDNAPPFAKPYADIGILIQNAAQRYKDDVEQKLFPDHG